MIEWMVTVKHDGTEEMDKMATLLVGRPPDSKVDEEAESARTWLFASQQEAFEAERRLRNISDFRVSVEDDDREALVDLLREYVGLEKPTDE